MEILTENDLIVAVKEKTLIIDGKEESCEGIKYDFTLSKMALTVESGRPRDIDESKENALIKPGEIAFVITEESLELPNDVYCQLSTKRKLSLDGIVLLGGLIIDPNYKGKLIFGLYNLSSRNYLLMPGKKLVAGVFYKVDKTSDKHPEPIYDFPEELIKTVIDTKPNSIGSVNAAISDINDNIRSLKAEINKIQLSITNDDKWKTDFQTGLTDIRQLVKEIGEELSKEVKTRSEENIALRKEHFALEKKIEPLSKIEKRSQFFKGIVVTLITGTVLLIIRYLIERFSG